MIIQGREKEISSGVRQEGHLAWKSNKSNMQHYMLGPPPVKTELIEISFIFFFIRTHSYLNIVWHVQLSGSGREKGRNVYAK